MAISSTSQTTSTYLINSSNKCIIPALGKDKEGVPWTAYGDVDSKCLESIGFTFKEDFTEGNNIAEEEVEKVLKPINIALQGIVRQIPMLKDVQIDTKNLRESAIYAYTLIKTFGGNDTESIAKDLNKLFQRGQMYRMPVRKGAPSITPQGINGQKITIKFQYGKCNLFSAKREVWEPLQKIKAVLFPSAEKLENETGLVKFSGINNVPMQQQIPSEIIRTIAEVGADTLMGTDTKISNILGTIKPLTAVMTKLQKLGEAGEIDPIGKEVQNKNSGKVQEWITTLKDNLQEATKNAGPQPPETPQPEAIEVENWIGKVHTEYAADLDTYAESYMLAAKDAAAGKPDANIQPPKRAFKVKDNYKGTSKNLTSMSYTIGTVASDSVNVESILAGLVNVVPKIIGATNKNIVDSIQGGTISVQLGYPSVYDTTVKDLWEKIEGHNLVTLSNLFVQKANISFDFKNTDEYGYPMSGTLTLEETWNLMYPSMTLDLNNGAASEDLVEGPMTYIE